MAESKVQLKREEIVGDEVVLEDIDPKTSTGSVVDEASGLNLNEVIARLKDDINSQLSRVVNSVNGRTGVVVLTSKDVGLGNVDNVSFADIQNWTLDELEHAFLTRGFKIFETLNEVDTILNDQDHTLNGSGFFTKTGHIDDNDKKSYIGYFALDENNILVAQAVSINNIGATDNSLLYDEKAGDKDYTGGKLGINIWKDEDGLEVYNGISETDDPKENSGLRLVRENIVPHNYYFEGFYGSDWEHPGKGEDSLLYTPMEVVEQNISVENAPQLHLFFDTPDSPNTNETYFFPFPYVGSMSITVPNGITLPNGDTTQTIFEVDFDPFFYMKPWFRPKLHDILIFGFTDRYLEYLNTELLPTPPGMQFNIANNYFIGGLWKALMNNNPCIGEVTKISYNDDGSYKWIEVRTKNFVPQVSYGLEYASSDKKTGSSEYSAWSDYVDNKRDTLFVKTTKGRISPEKNYTYKSLMGSSDEKMELAPYHRNYDKNDPNANKVNFEKDINDGSGPGAGVVDKANLSGLNSITSLRRADPSQKTYPGADNVFHRETDDWKFVNLPTGPSVAYDKRFSQLDDFSGLNILPDASLCVIPVKTFLGRNLPYDRWQGSSGAINWRADASFYVPDYDKEMDSIENATIYGERDYKLPKVEIDLAYQGGCMLGINLNKAVVRRQDDSNAYRRGTALANLSGLKIFKQSYELPAEFTDFTDNTENENNWSDPPGMTGGIGINCGVGLKIEPPTFFMKEEQFYDGGKLCIDFDAFDSGLEEDEEGKLTVSVGYGKGVMKYPDNTIGVNLKKSAIGFNSAGAPDINVLKQWTGLSSQYLMLDADTLANFKANGSYYESISGKPCAKALVINTGDGIKIDTKNAIAVRVATKTRKLVDGVPQKDSNGKLIYTPHGHGLCIYEDPTVNDTRDQMTDESYNGGAIGVQVVDPGTNTGHGITINEHGTLCVDFSANTENGDNSGIVEDIKKNLKLDEWTITGNEVVTVNNIPQTDPTKVTYTYNPTNQPLNIKLGKGLIFIDERGLNDNDEDDDGCGCPNCKCNYCDYVVNMPGKETFHVLEWIRSDGLQRIDLDMQFSSDNTHIFEPIYMHTVGTDEDKRDYSNGTQIIFAAGRLNAIGTHTLICDKGTTYAEIIDKNEDAVKTEKNIKRDPGKKFSGSITYKVTKIIANWKYGDGVQLEPDEIPDPFAEIDNISEEVPCDSDGLAVSLVSIFGVPHKLGGNLSTNAKITMYGFKIYEKTKLKCIADLVPVKCVCDNGIGPRHGLVGMFDRISNTFYPNSAKETGISPNFIAGPETDVILNSKGEDISAMSGEKAVTYIGLRHITSETMSNKIIIDDAPLNPEAKKRIIQVEFVNIHGGATIKRQDILTIGDGERGTQRFFLGGPGGISKSASVVNNDGTEAIAEQNESSAIGTDMRTFIGYVTFSTDTKLITGDLIHISDEAAQEIVRSQSSAGFNTDKLAAGPITLFSGYSNSNIITDPALIRLYSIKILEDDKITPIVDLKPVIRSDNVVGLLDVVNKKFYQDKDDTLFTASRETTGVIYNWQGEEIKDT